MEVPGAIATLHDQLSDAVALDNPVLKPNTLTISPREQSRLDKATVTGTTPPTLLTPTVSIAHGSIHPTLSAVLFYFSLKRLSNFQYKHYQYKQLHKFYQHFLTIMPIARSPDSIGTTWQSGSS
jgi:hypothetical protein